MKTFKLKYSFPLLFLLFLSDLSAAVTYTQGSTAQELADQIQGVGITITNPVITHGAAEQVGIYSDGSDEGLEVDEGIILTCMTVNESFTKNSSGSTSLAPSGNYNDSDLLAIDNRAYYNPVIFEFDVTLDDNTRLLLVDYQFASEEYNEFVGSQFNDAFGFFISGGDLNQTYNIARVVDNQTYVTIDNIDNYDTVTVNNVNNGVTTDVGYYGQSYPPTNSSFYIDNTNNKIDVEYDGLTHTLHATLDNLTPGETYHFKMAIADTADAQWDTGVFVNKINGLREPSICYDYAFKQNEQYITSDYNASVGPYINADVIANDTNYPLNLAIYIKNIQDSEITASNILVDIFDINTSQATYDRESVWVTETGELYPTKIDDADLNVSDSYVKEIPVDSFDAFEYFYTYYSLNPLENELDMPINARITYDLTIPLSLTDSITVTRSSLIDADIPICNGDSSYNPVAGIFTAVHNDYYNLDIGGTRPYYNIPTQVTSREGNFKVLSLDVNDTDLLVPRSTMVAVELVDVGAFHDTEATCTEQSNAISERVWIRIGNDVDENSTSAMFDRIALQTAISEARTGLKNGLNTLASSWDFYKNARKNAAFRISYNRTNDGNDDLVKVTPTRDNNGDTTGTYSINFPEIIHEIDPPVCAVDMDGNPGNVDTIGTWCRNNSDKLTMTEIAICMECVYGYNVKFECSRDNFAIRPEAFLMHVDDQNQSNPSLQQRLTTNYSGVTAATAAANLQELNLAAGYNYDIEVNATNHRNNISSNGYTKSFNPDFNTTDKTEYMWEERTGVTANACNDDRNQSIKMTFNNGLLINTHTAPNVVDTNTSLYQVGEYELRVLDTTWTAVDSDPALMTHHMGAYFLNTNTLDCTPNSSATYPVDTTIDLTDATTLSNSLVGCNISSSHTNSHSNLLYNLASNSDTALAATDLKYNSYDVEFHPYKFTINNTVTLGLYDSNNTTGLLANTVANPFVYMSNINSLNPMDENMSVHFNTIITATGKNGTSGLTNFVTGCYAEPLDLNISKSATGSSKLVLSYNYYDYNSTQDEITANSILNSFIDHGNEDVNVTLTTLNTSFQKDLNGTINTKINLNFNREVNESANPEKITFIRYDAVSPNNLYSADLLNNQQAEGNFTLDQNVTFYYGRTAARKTREICDTNSNNCDADEVFIYYEVFCHQQVNNQWCNNANLPKDISGNSLQKVDTRWFQSLDHNITTYGQITNTVDKNNPTFITLPSGITHNQGNEYISDSVHRYQITNDGLPYVAEMDDTVPGWLLHDENNASTTTNSHTVIYRGRTEWTGEHEADSTTKTDRVQRVNRRTMW